MDAGRKPEVAIFIAAGLSSAGLIWLFTNGVRSITGRPPLHAGEAAAVKSPASMAAVGTKATLSGGTERRRVRW